MKENSARPWAPELDPVLSGLRLEYSVDRAQLANQLRFHELAFDAGTEAYVRHALRKRHGRFLAWLHGLLQGFLSDFDINGLLGLYPMHVLSEAQWRELFQAALKAPAAETAPLRSLLDIGAGRGDVTSELARCFQEVTATETSKAMVSRLAKRGFRAVHGDLAEGALLAGGEKFDAVSLLNVLDRCDRPLSLLGAARSFVREGGLFIVALVLPYDPFVYDGGRSRAPRERLPIHAKGFERAASEFVQNALLPLGLEPLVLSRVPYLSGGDPEAPLYELDDVIVICRAGPDVPLLRVPDPVPEALRSSAKESSALQQR
jgi:SAM-dependent methyltransferase